MIQEAARRFAREGFEARAKLRSFPQGKNDGSPRLEPSSAQRIRADGGTDEGLFALASELEAAARPYLAYDRDAEVTSADPDCEEAWETARRLYGAVRSVADRIFTHQPESLAGLLVLAHTAALTCSDSWEDDPDNGGRDGQLLRFVCNALFRLVGVDWRGNALSDAEPPAAPQPAPTLAAMVTDWRALKSWLEGPHSSRECDADDHRLVALQRRILAYPCMGLADLCAKLPLFREELEVAEPKATASVRPEYLHVTALRGLVRDLEGLSGGPSSCPIQGPAAPGASLDAALIPLAEAAIAEERAAVAVSEAASHDAPPGTFARLMQLLDLVTAMDAQTPAGLAAKARVLLTHMPEVDEASYDWRCEALSLSIARDAARLGAAG